MSANKERTEFIDLVDELNNEVFKEGNYFENNGIGFSYRTNGWQDLVLFDEKVVYNSEYDELYEYNDDFEDEVAIPLKTVVIRNFREYVEALNSLTFFNSAAE